MSCMSPSDKYIAVARGLQTDFYDYSTHYIIDTPATTQSHQNDHVADIVVSRDSKYLAVITSSSKQLLIYELPVPKFYKTFVLPRSASKIRFTQNNKHILVADKSGDVLIYNIDEEKSGSKLLGHLSLLLDVLQTDDEKYIISSDRDEKIRVSCYPNTYNIETFCLGHTEFVNHLELLPHDSKYLTSTSGDGTLKFWDYTKGTACYTIDTYVDVNDDQLKKTFVNLMDSDGVEVNALPIVHYAVSQLDESSSLLAVTVHSFDMLLIYSLQTINGQFTHRLEDKLKMERFPASIQFHKLNLFIYDQSDCQIIIYKLSIHDDEVSLDYDKSIKVFENTNGNSCFVENCFDSIKVLYKRKFDNVQEYQERKKQRLEKSAQ